MSKVDEYLKTLHNVYIQKKLEKDWSSIVFSSITEEEERQLKEIGAPNSLVELLKKINGSSPYDAILGTYENELISYCLFSASQILSYAKNNYLSFVSEMYEYTPEEVDEKIDGSNPNLNWLCIGEDSFNNGGTSSLFIDLTPSELGKVGQVVIFVHDDDELLVIADSFDSYLDKLIETNCPFIEEPEID